MTYDELRQLKLNGELIVGDEYIVDDYPTYKVILKASSADSFDDKGRTEDGCELLFDFENCKTYFYKDNDGNSGWFDIPNSNVITDSENVTIMPYYVGGVLTTPDVSVTNSNGVTVYPGDITITDCNNIIIGEGNNVTLNSSEYVTIGDNNNDVEITSVSGCSIGDDNESIYVYSCDGVSIGDRNYEVEVSGDTTIIGSDSRYVTVSGTDNVVLNDNVDVTVTSDINVVNATKMAVVGSRFNVVGNSEAIDLEGSVGNDLKASRMVHLEKVNNSDFFIDNITISSDNNVTHEPFIRYRHNEELGVKVAERMISKLDLQSDNAGTILDLDTNTLRNLKSKGVNEYRQVDGIWTTEEKNKVTVDFQPLSKTDTLYVDLNGAGEYVSDTLVTISATMYNGATFDYWIDLSDGTTYESNPLSFRAKENKTFQIKYKK